MIRIEPQRFSCIILAASDKGVEGPHRKTSVRMIEPMVLSSVT